MTALESAPPPPAQLASELTALLGSRVSFGEMARGIHATDASHYQIMPAGVVTPADEAELSKVLSLAARHRVPVTARGAATSLSGQTHGTGLVHKLVI